MQQLAGTPSYSTTLLSMKIGKVSEPKPRAASFGIRPACTLWSHQPISIAPSGPHDSVPSAAADTGTFTVIGVVVVGTRFTWRSGLSPVGLVWLKNSARRKTLANWPVPTDVPPQVYALFLNTGDLSSLVIELDGAHESATVGSKVSPPGKTAITGTMTVLTSTAPLVRSLNGSLPTIVYGNVVAPSVTVWWNSGIDGAATLLGDALMFGVTPSSYRAFITVLC